MSRRLRVRITQLTLLVLLLAGWQVASVLDGGVFVPSLPTTAMTAVELLASGLFWEAWLTTNMALLIGYPIGLLLGVAAGLVLGRIRLLDRGFGHFVDLSIVIPMVALVPVVIVAFGLGLQARTGVVVVFTAPVVALNARASIRILDTELVQMASAFRATRVQLWTTVILPSATRLLVNGARLGMAQAVSGMVAVELILVPAGVGGLIIESKAAFDAPTVYALTALLVAEALLLVAAMALVERRLLTRLYGTVEP